MAGTNTFSNNVSIDKENMKLVPNITTIKYKKNHQKKDAFSKIFLLVCIIGISMSILLEIVNMTKRNQRYKSDCSEKIKYWIYSKHGHDVNDINGILKHLHSVLQSVGAEKTTNQTAWDLLWSHDSPSQEIYQKLQPHQKVNHIPGSGSLTAKDKLAPTHSAYIPKAFKLPRNKNDFYEYAKKKNMSMFLEKSNDHRGVRLKNVSEIDVSSGTKFVQEFIERPFLVDGHKFDLGVYVVITSVDPLRAYWYKGDVLIRYCHVKYYPFDPSILDKYVIGMNYYLPTWEVPSLAQQFTALGHGMKDSFDIYVRSKGRDPSVIWNRVQKAIANTLVKKAPAMVTATNRYPSQDNFFELMRFDLIVDEDLKVYLLEANMSPNLDSTHFKQNALLYEQVLYNLFLLTGIAHKPTSNKDGTKDIVSANRSIATFGEPCHLFCRRCVTLPFCELCGTWLDHKLRSSLLKAHTEFLHRGDFRRLVPPPLKPEENARKLPQCHAKYARSLNKLQHMWYQEKCNKDITWCI